MMKNTAGKSACNRESLIWESTHMPHRRQLHWRFCICISQFHYKYQLKTSMMKNTAGKSAKHTGYCRPNPLPVGSGLGNLTRHVCTFTDQGLSVASRFPCCVFHHICLWWYLSSITADEYRYEMMKINVNWVGQSTNSTQFLDLVPWPMVNDHRQSVLKTRKLMPNYTRTHLALQLQINSIICSVCHKCLCSHVCGLHISMVHSILLHCVRMCSMNGEQRSVQASQTAACSPSHTNRTSYAGDIFLAFYFSRTSLCRRHSSSFLLFPAACIGVTD